MGLVRDHLVAQVREQIRQHHVVVWFDPGNQYGPVAEALALPDGQVVCYDPCRGFLALRRDLEPLWSQVEPPCLLLYVPLAQEDTQHALVEYTAAGVVMQPGQQPPARNTRLAVIAREALGAILPSTNLHKIVAEVENGQLTLAELDEIGERYREVHIGALALLYKTENSEEIALRFLTQPQSDEEMRAKDAVGTLVALLRGDLELAAPEGATLPQLRAALGRHLLATEFLSSLGEGASQALATIPQPASRIARETAARVARAWRLRRDLAESYVETARRVEVELGLASQPWSRRALQESETFPIVEKILQREVASALVSNAETDLVAYAQARSRGFWASHSLAVRLHWQVIAGAGQVLVHARPIGGALKQELSAATLVKRYVGPAEAWCRLDTAYRRLEGDERNLDVDGEEQGSLQQLLTAARHAYADVLDTMAERFVRAYERAGLDVPRGGPGALRARDRIAELVQQNAIYADFVGPALEEGRTAYLLVDALRYEMALEFLEQASADWSAQLVPALATPPTITEVGMAALMPGAERGLTLLPAGSGKLAARVLESTLKGRADRVKHLEEHGPEPTVVVTLDAIAPLRDKRLGKALAGARLAVVTASDEIDGLWESHPEMARRLQDDVFSQLRRGVRALFGLGFRKVIVTSDHGFIAGDDLATGTPIDPPGGETADLHRRVWVGVGGAETPSCLRKPLSALGLGGSLELVTPYGLGVFKAPGGSTQYYHGGLSLQEMIIPILVLSAGKARPSAEEPHFRWSIALGSKQVSTRFFSVTVSGSAEGMFAQAPRIRAELRAGQQALSTPVAATYGFDEVTHDVAMELEGDQVTLKSNTITLHVADIPAAPSVTLHLLHAETGVSLHQVQDIPVSIAF